MRRAKAAVTACILGAIAPGAVAQLDQLDPFAAEESEPHTRMSLVADHASVAPGQTFALGVSFEIDEGWHMYWNGKNDTGFPPRFEITGPPGFEIGKGEWPAPHRMVSAGDILDHVYEGRLTIVVPVKAPESLEDGSQVEFHVKADWLVCEAVCIPEEGEATLTVHTGEAVKSDAKTLKLFEEARKRIPKPAPASVWKPLMADTPFSVQVSEGGPATVQISSRGVRGIRFFPSADCPTITNLIEAGDVKGGRTALRFDRHEDAAAIRGVVEIVGEEGSAFYTLSRRGGEAQTADE
ncbi:MAG: protein-disulfide reductase DsbD family protein [Phycisphaerales bacterium]